MIAWDADKPEKWQDYAACAQTDPDLFFPEKGGAAGYETAQAKDICRECPVRLQCLQYAMADEPGHGVFGGLTVRERQSLRSGMRRRVA